MPIIGITNCSKIQDYVTSVDRSGGTARVLQFDEDPQAVLETVDGLLLTGGGDVDPVRYGETRHGSVELAESGRDDFELTLARLAVERDVPLLAICRGAQVLNVSRGGTLVQDIPSAIETDLPHSLERPKDAQAHDVRVSAGSVLARALGEAVAGTHTCRVNSRHHQSVGTLGASLVAAAHAADGVIEAIESPAARFCVGVQWHPENFWRTGEFKPLFDAFVRAATEP